MIGNHTKTPWVYVHESTEYGSGDDDVTFGYLMQEGDEQYQIAAMIVDTIDGRANAESVVTAVNSYADMLEALVMIRDADNDCKADGLPTIPPSARAKIDAAIAKAEGQS